MERLTLTRPDDWHVHLRDDAALATTVPHTARRFGRAIVMPNLAPPVTTTAQAADYRRRILSRVPNGCPFEPLMTLYLTDHTTPEEIRQAAASGFIPAAKLYPAGATTHSEAGVTDLERIAPVLETMAETGMLLLIHGEVTDPSVDIFDREAVFIERHLEPLVRRLPGLRIVLEHITTEEAVAFVTDAPDTVGATLTPHHLLLNRNALLAGGVRPHHYCLPVLKRERHRQALLRAATGGNPRFFAGTDSAPHERGRKETACGCAGIYSAHGAIELYAEIFAAQGALDRLEAFCSFHGADFYGLPRNETRITLVRQPWRVPGSYPYMEGRLVPLRAGEEIAWRIEGDEERGLRSED
ncbi:MAG TPA: dihydroorotase [Gammaproteobacteria bacterium]|nr:dihydroorotase [Gammaproteobacteria bacterium]